MKVVTSLADFQSDIPSVVSIGNFDGLHLGHRAILETVARRARELGARPMAMTFEPHPIRFFAPERAPRLITTLAQKTELIRKAGIDLLFIASFDAAFAALGPDTFIQRFLVDGLRARAVCVGANFNFGFKQSGRVVTLKQWRSHFETIEVPPVSIRGIAVSSTAVRQAIADGAVGRARRLLGRWMEIEGRIVTGAGRGQRVTVPTLNLAPANELLPRNGVYVSRIAVNGGPYLDSVTNIGVNPTFGTQELSVETHILSDAAPAAADAVRLQILFRLRDERRFDGPGALRAQIATDIRRAHRFFQKMRACGHAFAHTY